jgi:hypothetical protein
LRSPQKKAGSGTHKYAGPDTYNSTLWPKDSELWRERISACPASVHNMKFWPKSRRAQLDVRRANREEAEAGTDAAWEGGRRKFRDAAMDFDFGPEVRAYSCMLGPVLARWLVRSPG